MRELTFNITEDKRFLVEPTNVENFNLTFDKPNWVQGRVGEDSLRQVFVNVVTGPNNEPYDLTGINPEFDGLTAKGGPENRNYVVIDNHHSVMIDAQGGRFRFDFPKEAFAIAGSYKQAFFSLKREGTGEVVATLEFDMKVMANFVYDGVVAFDYVTPFEDLYHQLEQIIETANGDITSKIAEWQTNFQNKYNELTQLGIDTTNALATVQSRLNDLAEQIESKGLITKLEVQQLVAPLASKTDVDAMSKTKVTKFETLNDLKQADLSAGQLVVTLHGWNSNDSDGAHYIISNAAGDGAVQLNNGLFASRYETDWNIYYDETEIRNDWKNINHTVVNEVFVNQKDKNGNYIVPEVVSTYANAKNPDDYAIKNYTSLTINGALTYCSNASGEFVLAGDSTVTDIWRTAAVVGNGQVLHEVDSRSVGTFPSNFTYVGFKENGSYGNYPANDWNAQEMVANGVKNAFLTYAKIITNGESTDLSNFSSNESSNPADYINKHNPLIGLGFKQDGTLVIVATDGRLLSNRGLTVPELTNEMKAQGVVDGWLLDGGGSTSVILRGTRLNAINDTHNGLFNSEVRPIAYSLSFKKKLATNGALTQATKIIRATQQSIINQQSILAETVNGTRFVGGWSYDVTSEDELISALNSIRTHIPDETYSGTLKMVGDININYYNSSVAQSLGVRVSGQKGLWRYELMRKNYDSGELDYEWIRLTFVRDNLSSYNVWSQRTQNWLGWHGEGVAHTHYGTVRSEAVTSLNVTRSGGTVLIRGMVDITKTNLSNWTLLANILPTNKMEVDVGSYCPDQYGNFLKIYMSGGQLYGRYIENNASNKENSFQFNLTYQTKDAMSVYITDRYDTQS